MLQRPIIVLSEKYIRNLDGEAVSVNDLFGIYLPILLTPDECCREPVVLAYNQFHFCPLQSSRPGQGPETFEQQLPLYPSINDTYDQKLLATRFLGNDVTKEESRELLIKYLSISELPYSFDASSAPLKILCAALGTHRLPKKDDFLVLYHDYCKDFFELQLPNALAEEKRRADKQRQLDYIRDSRPSYDTDRRQFVNTVSLPRLDMPSRSFTRLSGRSQPRDGGLPTIDPMSTEGYTPRTEGVFVSKYQAPLDEMPFLPGSVTATSSGSSSDFLHTARTKPMSTTLDAENISNSHLREKDSNRPSPLPTPTEYRDGKGTVLNYFWCQREHAERSSSALKVLGAIHIGRQASLWNKLNLDLEVIPIAFSCSVRYIPSRLSFARHLLFLFTNQRSAIHRFSRQVDLSPSRDWEFSFTPRHMSKCFTNKGYRCKTNDSLF